MNLRSRQRPVQKEVSGNSVTQTDRGGRTHGGRKGNGRRTATNGIAGGGGLARVELRVVDARADVGAQADRLVKERVVEQQGWCQPPCRHDLLIVVRHGTEFRRSFAVGLRQRRRAQGELSTEVRSQPAYIREV